MAYIPKRVLHGDFPEEGIYGITARQALEAAIDGILPAYHLIPVPVILYEYRRGAPDPLGKNFQTWGGLTVRVPMGVLYRLNFYPRHRFQDGDGKPTAVPITGPLGTPSMRPEVEPCDEYLLWPESEAVTFELTRLFFEREDLENFSRGRCDQMTPGTPVGNVAGQLIVPNDRPAQLPLIAVLLELLSEPARAGRNQAGVISEIQERYPAKRGLGKRNLEDIFGAANKAMAEAE